MNEAKKEQPSFLALKQHYTLRKIVYVNSATHGYSEFSIDQHMALFGQNNRGKTASLAGLKLALFSENSFTHCKRKFKFTGKDSDYSKEDSYAFYFPSYISYIITEIENPNGVFSMVLYKARGEWQYGRFFVPVSFETIKSLFWDTEALNGEGDFAESLAFDRLKKGLKTFGAVQVTDEKTLAEYLYAGHSGDPSQARFCLYPLTSGANASGIEAFRHLYQLAFDIGQADKGSLPRAIATIIEMERSRQQERLSADFDALMLEYHKLSESKTSLTRLDNCTHRFKSLDASFNTYTETRKALSQQLSALYQRLEVEQHELDARYTTIHEKYLKAEANKDDKYQAHALLVKGQNQLEGQLTLVNKKAASTTQDYLQSQALINGYGGKSLAEILGIYDEQITEEQIFLESLRSKALAVKHLEQAIKEKNRCSVEQKELTKKLNNNQVGMLDQLTESQAGTLYSLNTAFAQVSDEIPAASLQTATAFANLFDAEGEVLTFCGEALKSVDIKHYRLESARDSWKARLKQIDIDLSDLSIKIDDLRKGINDDDSRVESIEKHQKELKNIQAEKRLASANEQLRMDSETAKEDLGKLNQDKAVVDDKVDTAGKMLQQTQAAFLLIENEKKQLQPRRKDIQKWLDRLRATFNHVGFELDQHAVAYEGFSVDEQRINDIDREAQTHQTNRLEMIHALTTLYQEALPAEENSFESIDNEAQLSERMTTLRQAFAELPQKKALHEKAVKSHNDLIDGQLQEIREARDTVERYVQRLNDEVNKHQISNLDAIRIRLTFNPRFMQLMSDVDKYNLYDHHLLDKAFYDRLRQFCEEFFDDKKRTLNLAMLMESIHYEYKQQGEANFDRKSQSGGTTSTTTALILAVLLGSISPEHVSVGIPIVVDEIGTLDSKNTLTAIQTIAEQGFAVFCATPKPEPALMESIKRWVTIDRFQVEQPRVNACRTLILNEFVESIGDVPEEAIS